MSESSWAAWGLLVALCWIGGVRILRSARRSEQIVEWGFGVMLIMNGGIGFPLLVLRTALALPARESNFVFATGVVALSLSSIALYVLHWRLFRPHSVGAALICSAGSFVIAWSFLAELLTVGFAWGRDPFWFGIGGAARSLPYAWGGVEAFLAARDARSGQRGRLVAYGAVTSVVAATYAVGLINTLVAGGMQTFHQMVYYAAFSVVPGAISLWVVFARRSAARREPGAQRSR